MRYSPVTMSDVKSAAVHASILKLFLISKVRFLVIYNVTFPHC